MSHHKFLAGYFCQKFQDYYGVKYIFKGDKDGANLKQFIQALDGDLDRAKKVIDQFFKTDDEWINRVGRSISIMNSQINKLNIEIAKDDNEDRSVPY